MCRTSFGALFINLTLPFNAPPAFTSDNGTLILAADRASTSFFDATEDQLNTLRLSGCKPSPLSPSLKLDSARRQEIESWQEVFTSLMALCEDNNKPFTLGRLYASYQKEVDQAFLNQDTQRLDVLSGAISVMRHVPVPCPKKKSDTDPVGHILSDFCASYFLKKVRDNPVIFTNQTIARVFYEKTQAIWHMMTNYRGCIKQSIYGNFFYTLQEEEAPLNMCDRSLWYILKSQPFGRDYTQILNFEDLFEQSILYLGTSILLSPCETRFRFRLMEILFGAPFSIQKKKKYPLYLNYYLQNSPLLEGIRRITQDHQDITAFKNLMLLYENCNDYAYRTACVQSTVIKTVSSMIKEGKNFFDIIPPLINDQAPQNDAYHP